MDLNADVLEAFIAWREEPKDTSPEAFISEHAKAVMLQNAEIVLMNIRGGFYDVHESVGGALDSIQSDLTAGV